MWESDLLRRGGEEEVPDLEREEGEWPMLRNPGAGGGGGGHPGRATLVGVGAGGFADLGGRGGDVGREGGGAGGRMGWEIGRDGESIESLWGRRSSGWCGGAAGTVVALAWQGRNPQQRRRRLWVRALLGWAGPQTSRSLTGFSLFFPFFFCGKNR